MSVSQGDCKLHEDGTSSATGKSHTVNKRVVLWPGTAWTSILEQEGKVYTCGKHFLEASRTTSGFKITTTFKYMPTII